MTTEAENAEVAMTWKEAGKLRKSLVKHIHRLIEGNTTANDKKTFEKVDDYLAKYRLSCMQVIFADFEYAYRNHVQRDLWDTQLHVSKLYRSVIKDSRGQHVALRRIEKRYAAFLSLCQMFYEGYIHRLAAAYEIPSLMKISNCLKPTDPSISTNHKPTELSTEFLAMVSSACHDALIALGDLARYHLKLKGKTPIYESAVSFYALANDLDPEIAHGHHGIGLANVEVNKHFLVVYHMYYAVVARNPHPNALNNLATEFSHLRNPNVSLATRDPSPLQVLEIIFVRLHAFFYSGNEIPKRGELEQAFFRRLEEVLESIQVENFVNIIQMAIVNISACDVALRKKTEGSERNLFYEYVQAFTCRFAGYFAGTFTRRMHSIYALPSSHESNGKILLGTDTDPEHPFVLDCVADLSLRMLRIFSSWMVVQKNMLIPITDNLETPVTDFVCELARGLTTASIFFQRHIETNAQQQGGLPVNAYLLEEDLDLVQCPSMGAAAISGILENPKSFEPRAPFADYRDKRESLWMETLFRVTSILSSSQDFVQDLNFPITYTVLPGRQLVYAVDDEILHLAKEFPLGDGPSASFPVCLSVMNRVASPKQSQTIPPTGPISTTAPTPVTVNETVPEPSLAPQLITTSDNEVIASVPEPTIQASLSQTSNTNGSVNPPPGFQNVSQEQYEAEPRIVDPTDTYTRAERPRTNVISTNTSPVLDTYPKIPALSWSSVYMPKPANNAWMQLTAAQYYNGPQRRTSQQFPTPSSVQNQAPSTGWGGELYSHSPQLAMRPRVQQLPDFQPRPPPDFSGHNGYSYAEAEARWNTLQPNQQSQQAQMHLLTNPPPGFATTYAAQNAYTTGLNSQAQSMPLNPGARSHHISGYGGYNVQGGTPSGNYRHVANDQTIDYNSLMYLAGTGD